MLKTNKQTNCGTAVSKQVQGSNLTDACIFSLCLHGLDAFLCPFLISTVTDVDPVRVYHACCPLSAGNY